MLQTKRTNPNKKSEYEKLQIAMEKAVVKTEKPFLDKIKKLQKNCKHKEKYYNCSYNILDNTKRSYFFKIESYCSNCEKQFKDRITTPRFINQLSYVQNYFLMDVFNDNYPFVSSMNKKEIKEMIDMGLITINKHDEASLTVLCRSAILGRKK